jgi:hypothetical protein
MSTGGRGRRGRDMAHTSTLYLRDADFDSVSSWRILSWCLANGADEFTIDGESSTLSSFYEAVEPYRLPNGVRRRSSALRSEDLDRSTELWQLNSSTIAAIQSALHDGLFTYQVSMSGWLEDLTLYRSGEIVLAIVTHEHEGFLWVTDMECAELRNLDGIVLHETAEWI